MREEAAVHLRSLFEVMERLRAPDGCPWDRVQTHATLAPYLLEETYELLDAIDGGATAEIVEELGDVLVEVAMHVAIGAQQGSFDAGAVAGEAERKMVRRHPHVFGAAVAASAEAVLPSWERIKAAEKPARLSMLDGIPKGLPALAAALAVQRRPARLGLDPVPTATGAATGVAAALAAVTAGDASEAARSAAMGELLFAAVALARHLDVDPEQALRQRATAFRRRVAHLEAGCRADGLGLGDLDEAERARRWALSADPGAPPAP